jgi:hypothetical protein
VPSKFLLKVAVLAPRIGAAARALGRIELRDQEPALTLIAITHRTCDQRCRLRGP